MAIDAATWCAQLAPPAAPEAAVTAQLQPLALPWCAAGSWTATCLIALPQTVSAPGGAPPHRWWRHVYAGACLAGRLRPGQAEEAALVAALAACAPMVVAATTPRRLLAAELAAGRSRQPLAEVLAAARQPIRLGALAAAWAEAWGAPPAVAAALAALDRAGPLAHPLAAACATARWLLALKKMRAPLEAIDPPLEPATITSLGLDARGLVTAIVGLSAAADEGRQLARIATESAWRLRPRRSGRGR